MNKKLAILLASAAMFASACDSGEHNNLDCKTGEYLTQCLTMTQYMACENDKLVVKSCDEGSSCLFNENGVAECIVTDLRECSNTKPCADPNKMCSTDGKCVEIPVEPECTPENYLEKCPAGKPVCQNGKCVEKQLEAECTPENYMEKCPIARPVCKEGRCVEKPAEPECTPENYMEKCPVARPVCKEGKCVEKPAEGACESNAMCTSDKPICKDGVCTAIADIKCTGNMMCGDGYICDHETCIPENTCTKTHPCPDTQVCHNGVCIEKTISTCNAQKPCADASMTCVAGKCVACDCGEDETCTVEGTCIKTAESATKGIKVGDECEYAADFKFCEDNRMFTCSIASGEATHTVKVRDCGAEICTTSSSEGLGCYEPCDDTSDFFGECLSLYNSESGSYDHYAFLSICEEDGNGNKIWTFEDKDPACKSTCTNGACDYVHPEYAQSCYEASYAPKCDGDWYLFCATQSTQFSGIVSGENCPKIYSNDSYCAVDAAGDPQCVTSCTEEGATSARCMTAYGAAYSDSLVCKKSKDGKLAWFMTEYVECTRGCDTTTGQCK